ncbi:MAG: hypothetical protein KKA79_09360, partial [Nanoarchaeota archaeon]|nr:hypothetical protein [Nanoarchaeota archaeon]
MKKPNIKEKLKKLGKKAVLNCLISLYNAKANQHSKKSSKYRKTAQGYKSKLEEITGYKEATRKEPKNSNLESTVNNGYHASMEEFYQKCESENNISTSEIGKILAGDYRENGKRTWYWKDRIKKVKEYLKNNQGISELTQKQIFSILNKNKYFMRKKKTELISLKNVLFKNERIKKEINYHLQNTFYPKQETQSPKMIKKEYPTRIKDILKKTLYDKEEATNPSGSLENTLERETVKYDGKLVTLPSKGNLTVVGKIEGNLYLFNHIIKKFEEEYKNNKKTYLLLLGNYLDYSYVANVESDGITDDSITILNKLIKLNKKYGDNIISLTGEKELLHYLRDASEGHAWQKSSVREYKEEFIEKKEKELKEHAKYLERQPIAALIPKKFLFVASGPFKE